MSNLTPADEQEITEWYAEQLGVKI